MSVYCGHYKANSALSCLEQVILDLMESFLEVGTNLYVDNYYTTVNLANLFRERKKTIKLEPLKIEENIKYRNRKNYNS